jgi:acyl-CoA thioester hydrolase
LKPNPVRLEPASYPHLVDIQTRFADVDPLCHLNNVRILELYQEARASFNLALWDQSELSGDRPYRLVVARQAVDYLRETRWPQPIRVGVGISRLGSSSFSLGMAMFQDHRCVGVCDTVVVCATAQGPQRLPDSWREKLGRKLLPHAEVIT